MLNYSLGIHLSLRLTPVSHLTPRQHCPACGQKYRLRYLRMPTSSFLSETFADSSPAAAAISYHLRACASSLGTPKPFWYIIPRFTIALVRPAAAASSYHLRA